MSTNLRVVKYPPIAPEIQCMDELESMLSMLHRSGQIFYTLCNHH